MPVDGGGPGSRRRACLARSDAEVRLQHLHEAVEFVEEIAGISAGGMPERVKCLHALVGHALAAGPGVNPIGDIALARCGWTPEVCECLDYEVTT